MKSISHRLYLVNIVSVLAAVLAWRVMHTRGGDAPTTSFAVGMVVIIAVSLALQVYLHLTITRPLRRFVAHVERSRRNGDLTPFPSAGQDELARAFRAYNQLTRRLARRMDTLVDFAEDVSHDLRTPLTGIGSALELYVERHPELQGDDRELIDIATTEVRNLTQSTHLVLELAQLGVGRRTRKAAAPVAVSDLIADVIRPLPS